MNKTKGLFMSVVISSLVGCHSLKNKSELNLLNSSQENHLKRFLQEGRKKSPLDKKNMNFLTLSNGLKILLISDKGYNKSSAAMDVGVGSLEDPLKTPGMAHFLEHMLFLGTEKYPKVGEYGEYLAANQGMSNAYTSRENTNYYFEVNNEAFDEALDRFSQFFIAPLFDKTFVKREMNAVHSEHQKNLSSDLWRGSRVLANLLKKDHPQRKFSTGSLETLEKVDQKELLAFYKKYYSANRMSLVLMSPLSLEEQEKLVREKFSMIENSNAVENKYSSEIYDEKDLPRYVDIKSIKDLRTLELIFSAPSTKDYWKTKPTSFIPFLVGHEGKGSLLSLLKKKKLVTSLSAGFQDSSYASQLHVKMSLTEEGLSKKSEVITLFFAYIKMLKNNKLPRYIYEEVKNIGDIEFVYKEHQEGGDVASYYASKLREHPSVNIESELELLKNYSDEDYQKFLSYITPARLNALLFSKDAKTDTVEKYYKAEYATKKILQKEVDLWSNVKLRSDLALPESNQYIPKDLAILATKDTEKEPQQILSEEKGVFWFQTDTKFRQPKGRVTLLLEMKKPKGIFQHKIKMALYQKALSESLNEWKYQLNLAGLDFSVGSHTRGVSLAFEGYSEHIPKLMKQVVEKIREITISDDLFAIIKEEMKRKLRNIKYEKAYQKVIYELNDLADPDFIHYKKFYDPENNVDLISPLTLQMIKDFSKNLYGEFSIEGLAYGNFEKASIKEAVDYYFEKLGTSLLKIEKRQKDSSYKVQAGQSFAWPLKSHEGASNHAWVSYIQFGKRAMELDAALRIAESIIQPDFYHELRTKNQLGYIVHSGLRYDLKSLGLIFLVQSSTHDPKAIENYYDKWVSTVLEKVNKVSAFEFDSIKNAVVVSLKQEDKTITERHSTLSFEAISMKGIFNYKPKVAEQAEKLTKAQVIKHLESLFLKEKRASISVYLEKKKTSTELKSYLKSNHKVIADKEAYKKAMEVFE